MFTKKKKWISYLLVFAMIFSMLSSALAISTENVQAASSKKETNTTLGKGSDGKAFSSNHFHGSFRHIHINGKTAYCMNGKLGLDQYSNNSYTESKGKYMFNRLNSNAKKWIPIALLFGYNEGKGKYDGISKSNTADYIAATQTIIWELEGKYRSSPTSRSSATEYNDVLKGHSNAIKVYNAILKDMANYAKGPSFAGKSYPMTYDATNKVYKTVIKDTNQNFTYTASSKDGATITRNGYTYTITRTTPGTSNIKVKTVKKGNMKATSGGNIVWGATSSTTSQQALTYGAENDKTFAASFTATPSSLKIIKKNISEPAKIAGWQFRITGNGVNKLVTSGIDGTIATNLAAGTYTISEKLTKAQIEDKYRQQPPQTITLTSGVGTVTFTNEKTDKPASYSIQKLTSDGSSVAGFKFNIKGLSANSKTVTANEVVEKAKVTGAKDVKADSDDVKAINDAAKKGETGDYKVKLTGTVEEMVDGTDDQGQPTQTPTDVEKSLNITVHLRTVDDEGSTDNLKTYTEPFNATDFDLKTSATKLDKSYTTNDSGFISNEIPKGTYTISEVMTAEQLLRFEQPKSQEVTIDEDNQSANVVFTNEAHKADLEIVKKCADGNIEGIEFTISGKTAWGEDITPFTVVTDENGKITDSTKGLQPGTYTITETVDTDNYLPQEPKTVVLEPNDSKTVEFVNEPIVKKVMISKTDATTGDELPGALMQIKDTEGNVIHEWTSTDTPMVWDDLTPNGTYILHEDLAPLGYQLAQDIEFRVGDNRELDDNGMPYTKVEMSDEMNTLLVEKVDKDTLKALGGAKLQVLDAEGNIVVEFESDKLGPTEIQNASFVEGAKYTLHEVEAPANYVIAEDIEFVFTHKMKVQMQDKGTGTVQITKSDVSTGELLPNTGIEILDKNKDVIFKGKTDDKGVVKFNNLEVGTYYFREYDAPNGYQIDESPHKFQIKEAGEIVKCKMTNAPIGKKGLVTQTGDTSPLAFVIIVLLGAAIATGIVIARRKKKHNNETSNV